MGHIDFTFMLRMAESMRNEGKSELEIREWMDKTAKAFRDAPEQTTPHDLSKFSEEYMKNKKDKA